MKSQFGMIAAVLVATGTLLGQSASVPIPSEALLMAQRGPLEFVAFLGAAGVPAGIELPSVDDIPIPEQNAPGSPRTSVRTRQTQNRTEITRIGLIHGRGVRTGVDLTVSNQ